jgi:hypothetical protein
MGRSGGIVRLGEGMHKNIVQRDRMQDPIETIFPEEKMACRLNFLPEIFLKKLITNKKNENNRTGKRSGRDESHVHLTPRECWKGGANPRP